MKNLKIVLALVPLLFTACSDEYAGSNPERNGLAESTRMGAVGPENPSNPFDSAGAVYDEIIEMASGSKPEAHSVAGVTAMVDAAMDVHPEWGLPSVSAPLAGRVAVISLMLDSSDPLGDAIAGSAMGASAKSGLSGLVGLLSLHMAEPYEDFHSVSVDYEADIIGNKTYSATERQRLLEIASIARYSLYRKKRKDKDWETSVSIAGAVSGSDGGTSLAIRMAAAVGTCRKQGIAE